MASETVSTRSVERGDDLAVAAVYEREIGASLERVWENVYDWAHLPFLHSEAFNAIEKLDSGEWGWHARIGIGGGDRESTGSAEIELELVTDREARRYVSRTLVGPGAPSEIWTHLDPVAVDRTAIRVEFCVAPAPEDALKRIGKGFVSLYTLLWDQDEGMMQTREAALAMKRSSLPRTDDSIRVPLGPLDALRVELPLTVDFAGRSFRVVELDGELIAHGLECPHLLGPLGGAEIADGKIVCPWHGYAFDVRSGRSCDGRGLSLSAPPSVVVDSESGEVELHASTRGQWS
jgi:nitrite reductase/ring-hydroxylating ferredoxin subunit